MRGESHLLRAAAAFALAMARPLLEILLSLAVGPLPPTLSYVLGGSDDLLSFASGRLCCWFVFYLAIIGFYHTACPAIRWYCRRRWPKAPTSNLDQRLVDNMVEVSLQAFPLYVMVPVLVDLFRVRGWSMACDSVAACGGPARSLLGCAGYFLALEFIIFFDHYYLLHKWDWGKRLGQHAFHHVYKYADQLNAFSGYAFAPQDGFSQGLALAVCTLFVPVPMAFVYGMEVLTGLWTLYIHTDVCPLPWPLMGCDYHFIHHRYNWYNFGFMTLLFDTLFKTAKHPRDDAIDLALGRKEMAEADRLRSAQLTEAILSKRGREALSSDDSSDAMIVGKNGGVTVVDLVTVTSTAPKAKRASASPAPAKRASSRRASASPARRRP